MSRREIRPLNILVFGPTGVGKSTIINLLTNNVFKLPVGNSLESCTEGIGEAFIVHQGRKIFLYDTPGFDDSKIAPASHLKHLSTVLGAMYENDHRPHIHGILYVHRITDNRMSGSTLTNLRVFRNFIGKEAFKNLVFVTNRWTDPPNPQHERFEADLISNEKYFGKAVKEGARAGPAFRIKENAKHLEVQETLLDLFLSYDPVITQNQKETIDEHISPDQTQAGRVVNEALNRLRAEKDAEMAILLKELNTLEEREAEAREEIQREIEELKRQKDEAKMEQDSLRQSHAMEINRLVAEMRQGQGGLLGHILPVLGQLGSALITGAMSRRR